MGADPARDLRADAGPEVPPDLRGRPGEAAGRHAAKVQPEGVHGVRARGGHRRRGRLNVDLRVHFSLVRDR